MLKSISFHPKLAAALDLFINLLMLWWVRQFSSWWLVAIWLLFRFAIWGAFMWLVYYPAEMSRSKHLASLVVMTLGSLAFLLFIEWKFAWYLFGAMFSFFSFFSFWLLPSSSVNLPIFLKPHLRWRFIMSVIGLAGVFEGVFAVISFQMTPGISSWVWLALGSLFSASIAGWWWVEYGAEKNKCFWVWLGFWFLLVLELLWAVKLLPFGYLTSGLILIWIWYAVWLLARFNFTREGIDWRKQIWFLGFNSILFASFMLFVVRWK
jgi:hypothetical protein